MADTTTFGVDTTDGVGGGAAADDSTDQAPASKASTDNGGAAEGDVEGDVANDVPASGADESANAGDGDGKTHIDSDTQSRPDYIPGDAAAEAKEAAADEAEDTAAAKDSTVAAAAPPPAMPTFDDMDVEELRKALEKARAEHSRLVTEAMDLEVMETVQRTAATNLRRKLRPLKVVSDAFGACPFLFATPDGWPPVAGCQTRIFVLALWGRFARLSFDCFCLLVFPAVAVSASMIGPMLKADPDDLAPIREVLSVRTSCTGIWHSC